MTDPTPMPDAAAPRRAGEPNLIRALRDAAYLEGQSRGMDSALVERASDAESALIELYARLTDQDAATPRWKTYDEYANTILALEVAMGHRDLTEKGVAVLVSLRDRLRAEKPNV